jgi:hypothetical protein
MKINCTRRARSIDACEYQIQRNAYQSTRRRRRRRRLSTGKERYGTENASVYDGFGFWNENEIIIISPRRVPFDRRVQRKDAR